MTDKEQPMDMNYVDLKKWTENCLIEAKKQKIALPVKQQRDFIVSQYIKFSFIKFFIGIGI